MRARSSRGKTVLAVTSALALLSVSTPTAAFAAEPSLTIAPLEWSVVGLDSNRPAEGPNRFLKGAQVCNAGNASATDVAATWEWDSGSTAISLDGPAVRSLPDLAPGACAATWFGIGIEPAAASFDQTRQFHISATAAGTTAVSTATPREIYVERFVSQNRNSITASSGPTQVTVGQTYTFSFTGKTATTYEQLAAQPYFDPDIFEIRSVQTTVQSGQSVSQFYTDACGWNDNPASPAYLSCTGNGKAGGNVETTIEVAVVGAGTASVSALIYDFSGSSFHYNSDYGTSMYAIDVVAADPTPVPPVAADDTATTAEDTPTTINVLTNDNGTNLDPGTLTITTGPAHGTATVNPATGAVTYTPAPGYNGTDTFTYQICDTTGACDTATATITVTAANDTPNAINDTASTNQDTPVQLPVLTNDTDADGDTLTITTTTPPANGTVTINTNGTLAYTPAPGYTGTDTFTYTVSDGNGGTDTATVTITVNPATTTPVPPVAADDTATTAEDTPTTINVLTNDNGTNLDPGTLTITTGPAHGTATVNPATGAVTYTPAPGYNGTDTFTYQICDTTGACDTATATITVTAANDTPNAINDTAQQTGSVHRTETGATPLASTGVGGASAVAAGLGLICLILGSVLMVRRRGTA